MLYRNAILSFALILRASHLSSLRASRASADLAPLGDLTCLSLGEDFSNFRFNLILLSRETTDNAPIRRHATRTRRRIRNVIDVIDVLSACIWVKVETLKCLCVHLVVKAGKCLVYYYIISGIIIMQGK